VDACNVILRIHFVSKVIEHCIGNKDLKLYSFKVAGIQNIHYHSLIHWENQVSLVSIASAAQNVFKTYVEALNFKKASKKSITSLGKATQEILETLSDTGKDYKTVKEKLDEYFSSKKNVDYEIFQFRQATQQQGETVDQFITRLQKIAATYEFHDATRELKSAVINTVC